MALSTKGVKVVIETLAVCLEDIPAGNHCLKERVDGVRQLVNQVRPCLATLLWFEYVNVLCDCVDHQRDALKQKDACELQTEFDDVLVVPKPDDAENRQSEVAEQEQYYYR
jgi:hypothetical protein